MRGFDLQELPLDRALNVVVALMVDDAVPAWGIEAKRGVEMFDRRRVRGEVLRELLAQIPATPAAGARPAAPAVPERATWGLLPEHQAGLASAMRFVAGLN
jgi:hypothetical protein